MRIAILVFAACGLLTAQKQPEQPFRVLIGELTSFSARRIEVRDSAGTHVFYCDSASKIWRGKEYHDFSVLQVGDEVDIRYRNDGRARAIVIDLWANIDKVEGRIARVDRNGFQVDDYRRGLREIIYDSGTEWEDSRAEDLKVGRHAFVIGLKLPGGNLQATRVIVYEGRAPVRMRPSRILSPDGAVH